jgi:cytidine deaminase
VSQKPVRKSEAAANKATANKAAANRAGANATVPTASATATATATTSAAPALRGKHSAGLHALYAEAVRSRDNSYSPYSRHKVGAALRLADGRVFGGCNVENSSYGGAICAERTAIVKAVSESSGRAAGAGRPTVVEILVVTDSTPPWPPCGICRQVLSEFATPETRVHSTNLAGDIESTSFGKLLPNAFTPDFLRR